MSSSPIYVTQPTLAPLEEYVELLKGAWASGILTHNGPLVQRFEKELSSHLNLKQLVAVTNGTVAIQMAIKALGLNGEIITTPFSWIATISAIKWENCTPVFCDIEPGTFNIDPLKIEALITDKTVAIMPVHVFGNSCDIDAIGEIAKRHNIKVIYDAAHAVGATFKGKCILEYGDVSATSLHSTKMLNSAEGGACVTQDGKLHEKLRRIRFFGHDDKKDIVEDGFNGKMTEVHAALGIANLKYFEGALVDRKNKYLYYKKELSELDAVSFQELKYGESNYSYLPILLKSESMLMQVEGQLNKQNIFPRRYFYPSLNTHKNVVDYISMPISEDVSSRVLCLPLYFNLTYEDIDRVVKCIRSSVESMDN